LDRRDLEIEGEQSRPAPRSERGGGTQGRRFGRGSKNAGDLGGGAGPRRKKGKV